MINVYIVHVNVRFCILRNIKLSITIGVPDERGREIGGGAARHDEEDQQMDKKAALQKIETARAEIERKPGRGAWARGVAMYAEELLEGLCESVEGGWFAPDDLAAPRLVEKALLNGASDWQQYSWGGAALIYDGDIAERLCNPTELKRTDGGHKRPNAREEWLDTQARALFQASHRARAALAAALG